MVGNVSFRSAVFGGFNRDDVMDYIEKANMEYVNSMNRAKAETDAARERAQELDELNYELKNQLESQRKEVTEQLIPLKDTMDRLLNENEALEQSNMELSTQNQQLQEQIAQLQEELMKSRKEAEETQSTLNGRNNALSAQADQLREVLNRRSDALTQANAQLEEKAQTISGLEEKMSVMAVDYDRYHVICDHLGQIEAELQCRAITIEEEARKKADAQLEETRAYCSNLMRSANEQAAVLCRQMEENLEQIRSHAIVASEDMNQSISNTMSDFTQIQNMLQNLSGSLNEHVESLMAMNINIYAELDGDSVSSKEAAEV